MWGWGILAAVVLRRRMEKMEGEYFYSEFVFWCEKKWGSELGGRISNLIYGGLDMKPLYIYL